LGGVFLSSNWFFFIYIINHVNVKAASFSYLVCPIVTMLLSRFFLGEKLNKWQWSAVTLSAVGCWLLSLGHWEDLLYSLIVAFSYAAYLVSQRANSGFDSLLMLTLHLAVALVILAFLSPIYVFTLPQNEEFYQYMSILVVVLTILPLSLNLYSLKGISSSSVGMLLYINPLINFLMAIHYFNERVSALQLASYSIIVVSVLVFNKEFILNARPTKLEL
jgi:chloramphenicol-sensitive protein RarD